MMYGPAHMWRPTKASERWLREHHAPPEPELIGLGLGEVLRRNLFQDGCGEWNGGEYLSFEWNECHVAELISIEGGGGGLTFTATGELSFAFPEVTASSSMIFGHSAALMADADISGSAALVFGNTVAMFAPGDVSGTSALAFGATGLMTSEAGLSALAGMTFGQSVAMSAAAAIEGTCAVTFGHTADLEGSGGGVAAMTWNPSDKSAGITLSNTDHTAAAPNDAVYEGVRSTTIFNSTNARKLYFEVEIDVGTGSDTYLALFVTSVTLTQGVFALGGGAPQAHWRNSGNLNGGTTAWTVNGVADVYAAGDRLMFAVDEAARTVYIGKEGTWFNSSDPAAGTNASFTAGPTATDYAFCFHTDNNGGANQVTIVDPGSHSFSVPSGFTAI